jgi:hypothetical protein
MGLGHVFKYHQHFFQVSRVTLGRLEVLPDSGGSGPYAKTSLMEVPPSFHFWRSYSSLTISIGVIAI